MALLAVMGAQGGAVFGAEQDPAYLGAFGPDGTSTSDFERAGPVAVDQATGYVYVGDTVKQALYKFDEAGQPANFGGSNPAISGNEISGLAFNSANGKSQAAVNSLSHVIYVTSGNAVTAFEQNGDPYIFPAGPGEGTNAIPGATGLTGVAVDSEGNIYASDAAGKIRIYTSSGALLNEVEVSGATLGNLAVTPENGEIIFADTVKFRAFKLIPSDYPIDGSTTYTGQPGAIDDAFTISVGVDPANGFIYLTQLNSAVTPAYFRVAVFDPKGQFVGTLGGKDQEGELEGRPLGVAVKGKQRVYVSVRRESTTPQQSKIKMYEAFVFFEGPPSITATAVTDLTSTSAVLRAKVNPNTLETNYRFEYGLEPCAVSEEACTSVPLLGADIGAGHEPVAVSESIDGLSPQTTYYYRVVAENAEGVEPGPTRTFTTQGSSFGPELSDNRVWEQVTTSQKFSGGVTNGTLVQASADGNGVAFPTRGSIVEDPEGNRALEASAVLARRNSGGAWTIEDLVPPHTKATQFGPGPEYKVFSTDLSRTVLEPRDDAPLSPEASELTAYLRTNSAPPSFRPLVTSKEGFANVPAGTVFGGEVTGAKNSIALNGANEDLTDIVISSDAPLAADADPNAIYRWEDGSLEPVSELPADEVPAGGNPVVEGQVGSGEISLHHAVSADGTRIFWSPAQPEGGSLTLPALYLRDAVAGESVRIDVARGGSGAGEARPAFMGANADGSVVYFTDSQQLTSDANGSGRDLYRCEVGPVEGSLGCANLEDLSAATPGDEAGDSEEVASGLSDDGATVYFVAGGVLDTEPNESGEVAQAEGNNLYSWREGSEIRFVAGLSAQDKPDWGQPGNIPVGETGDRSSFSSPDGRYLTFMSERNLTGGESDDPKTGESTEQVFLYDSQSEKLSCLSCDPNGGTNAAHQIVSGKSEGGLLFPDLQSLWAGRFVGATLPEATESEPTIGYSFYQPRALLDNGRAFFNSAVSLVTGDANGTWDVYQYEPLGVGTCSQLSGSASVARAGDGCLSLISSGTDSNASVFLDASETGDDLFFMTFAPLAATDTDKIVDVYDARVDGVEAVVEPISECQGEACQSEGSAPADSPPVSAGFNGAGNVKAKPHKRCHKGQRKVKKKGKVKCVKKRKHHKSHSSKKVAK